MRLLKINDISNRLGKYAKNRLAAGIKNPHFLKVDDWVFFLCYHLLSPYSAESKIENSNSARRIYQLTNKMIIFRSFPLLYCMCYL